MSKGLCLNSCDTCHHVDCTHFYPPAIYITKPLATGSPVWLLLTSFSSFNITDDLLGSHLKGMLYLRCESLYNRALGTRIRAGNVSTGSRNGHSNSSGFRKKIFSSGLLMGPIVKSAWIDFPAFVSSFFFFSTLPATFPLS